MAELGLGCGCAGGGGYEGESDDSSFQAALEVFAKLKVLRGPGSCPGAAGSGRRGLGGGAAAVGGASAGGRLVGRPSPLPGRPLAFTLLSPWPVPRSSGA